MFIVVPTTIVLVEEVERDLYHVLRTSVRHRLAAGRPWTPGRLRPVRPRPSISIPAGYRSAACESVGRPAAASITSRDNDSHGSLIMRRIPTTNFVLVADTLQHATYMHAELPALDKKQQESSCQHSHCSRQGD